MSENQNTLPGNHLLAALPRINYEKILAQAEMIELNFGEIVYEAGEKIEHVYFPNSGIISLLSTVGQRSMLEIGIVGREGMAGFPVFLGVDISVNRAITQGDGTALKIKTNVFLKECGQNGRLFQLLQRFTHSFLAQVSQSAVCNRFHQIEARLARWLLMTHDRMGKDEFYLTQEFLSHMLGVRREAVTRAAQNFQKNQMISYSRGNLRVLDRVSLETLSCECYSIIKNQVQSVFS